MHHALMLVVVRCSFCYKMVGGINTKNTLFIYTIEQNTIVVVVLKFCPKKSTKTSRIVLKINVYPDKKDLVQETCTKETV